MKTISYDQVMKDGGYWIGIGEGQKFYTLWKTVNTTDSAIDYQIAQYGQAQVRWDMYIQNLSKEWEDAVKRAGEVIIALDGEDMGLCLEMVDHKPRLLEHGSGWVEPEWDRNKVTFGKYSGMTVKDIYEKDKRYLIYLAKTWFPEKLSYSQQMDFIREYVKADIEAELKYREEQIAKRAEQNAKSQWIGEVGQRMVFTATVVKVISGERESFAGYGTEYWHMTIMRDDSDNLITYWNTINFKNYESAKEGDRVSFKATIKKHDNYQGVKQTVVQRAANTVLITK